MRYISSPRWSAGIRTQNAFDVLKYKTAISMYLEHSEFRCVYWGKFLSILSQMTPVSVDIHKNS